MPIVIHRGYDELVMAQGLTSLHPVPRSVLGPALREAILQTRRAYTRVRFAGTSGWRARSDVLRVGHVDVWLERVTPQLHRVVGYVQQEYLHVNPRGAYLEVHELLLQLGQVLSEREKLILETALPFLAGVTLFADIAGWPFSRAMVRRFHSLVGRRFKDWGEGGTEFQGVQHARFFKAYLKTAQIRRYPSAAYVRQIWAQRAGFTSTVEPVWRIEYSWSSQRLHAFGRVDPGSLWMESLRLVRLAARNPGNEQKPLRDRRAARIWNVLAALHFDAPWAREPQPCPPLRLSDEAKRRTAVGMIAGYLAALVGDPRMSDQRVLEDAGIVMDCLMLDDVFRGKLVAAVRRRRDAALPGDDAPGAVVASPEVVTETCGRTAPGRPVGTGAA